MPRLSKPNNVSDIDWVFQNCVLVDTGYTTPCRVWQGPVNSAGYGMVYLRGRRQRAHIVAFGPVAAGMVRDHLCRTRTCCEPTHMRAVTIGDNVKALGSESVTAKNAAKTHCKNGHAFDETNTITRKGGGRDCRACVVVRYTKSNAKRRRLTSS